MHLAALSLPGFVCLMLYFTFVHVIVFPPGANKLLKPNREVCITKINSHIWHISVAFHKTGMEQKTRWISSVLVGGGLDEARC